MNKADIDILIASALEDNQKAYKKLLDEFWSYVYGFQISQVKDEYLAEDITIQTFAKAFEKLHTYNSEFNFKTWLITISKNLQVDHFRKEQRQVESHINNEESQVIKKLRDENLTAEDELIREQNLNILIDCVRRLKPDYQQLIMYRYFQELSYNDIATQCNEPLNTIKVKLMRAKKLLSEIILKHTDGLDS